MKRMIGLGLLALFAAGGVRAGMVRCAARAVKGVARVASQPARHPVKDGKAVGHAAKRVIW